MLYHKSATECSPPENLEENIERIGLTSALSSWDLQKLKNQKREKKEKDKELDKYIRAICISLKRGFLKESDLYLFRRY